MARSPRSPSARQGTSMSQRGGRRRSKQAPKRRPSASRPPPVNRSRRADDVLRPRDGPSARAGSKRRSRKSQPAPPLLSALPAAQHFEPLVDALRELTGAAFGEWLSCEALLRELGSSAFRRRLFSSAGADDAGDYFDEAERSQIVELCMMGDRPFIRLAKPPARGKCRQGRAASISPARQRSLSPVGEQEPMRSTSLMARSPSPRREATRESSKAASPHHDEMTGIEMTGCADTAPIKRAQELLPSPVHMLSASMRDELDLASDAIMPTVDPASFEPVPALTEGRRHGAPLSPQASTDSLPSPKQTISPCTAFEDAGHYNPRFYRGATDSPTFDISRNYRSLSTAPVPKPPLPMPERAPASPPIDHRPPSVAAWAPFIELVRTESNKRGGFMHYVAEPHLLAHIGPLVHNLLHSIGCANWAELIVKACAWRLIERGPAGIRLSAATRQSLRPKRLSQPARSDVPAHVLRYNRFGLSTDSRDFAPLIRVVQAHDPQGRGMTSEAIQHAIGEGAEGAMAQAGATNWGIFIRAAIIARALTNLGGGRYTTA